MIYPLTTRISQLERLPLCIYFTLCETHHSPHCTTLSGKDITVKMKLPTSIFPPGLQILCYCIFSCLLITMKNDEILITLFSVHMYVF